jgi:hypothetical protein
MAQKVPLTDLDDIKAQFKDAYDDVRKLGIPSWMAQDERWLVEDTENEYLVGVGAETDDAIGVEFFTTANAATSNVGQNEYARAEEFGSDNLQWLPKSQVEEL